MESEKIENYGVIGDLHTVALVHLNGSIDWLCLPRFDSGSCFTRLLGGPENGFWQIRPTGVILDNHHNYVSHTLVLETFFQTSTGVVKLTDFMPPRNSHPSIMRIVECVEGFAEMEMDLVVRFDYGSSVPWVRSEGERILMILGPHALVISSTAEMYGENMTTKSRFTISKGQQHTFTATYYSSISHTPASPDPTESLPKTIEYWEKYIGSCNERFGEYQEVVERSIITLKALTYAPTGGIVAAPTTSLPEAVGGVRNWDYRYCWLRDATFTLYALMIDGFEEEAKRWRAWLLRAAAGDPKQLQIMYGLSGERLIPEFEIGWLSGFRDSKPVRIGNAAAKQFQLDVYGELIDAFYQFRRSGIKTSDDSWQLQLSIFEFVEQHWMEPDEGIWEIRGPRRHFTYSKVMAWVVFDRAIKVVEHHSMKGPVKKWRLIRDEIFNSIMENGYRSDLGHFVQDYDSTNLDASLLLLPLVGFIDANDDRMRRTVEAIDATLNVAGLVRRYETGPNNQDGLPGDEGVFLACSFWLVDNLVLSGRRDEAKLRFDHLLTLGNELGLFSEEYDPVSLQMRGNFPQAFTHVGLINTARNLVSPSFPAASRNST